MVYIELDERDDLIAAMKKGLEAALDDQDISISATDDWRKPNLVWINKLLYRAITEIRENNLPILYSWWRYGPAMPLEQFRPGNLKPQEISQFSEPYKSPNSARDYPSPEEFRVFFVKTIKQEGIFERDLYNYLESVYTEDAPKDFRDLYLANLELQRVLYDLDSLSEGERLPYDDIEVKQERVRDAALQLEENLYNWEGISDELEMHVLEYLYLFEDTFEALRKQDGELLELEHILAFQELCSTYHGYVWRWVAYYISNQTVNEERHGAQRLIDANNEAIERAEAKYPKKLDGLEEVCADAGLIPSMETDTMSIDIDEELQQAVETIDDTALYE